MTYSQLKSDIVEYSARSDVSTKLDMFIRLAEARIARKVRVLEMETDVTLTFSSTAYEDDLPDGFQGFKRLRLEDSPNPRCKYVGPDLFADLVNLSSADFDRLLGDARLLYTIESGKVKVNQPRGSSETLELTGVYFKPFAALSDSAPNHALLEAHPDLYLFECLAQLWDWADELEQSAKYVAKADKIVLEIDELELKRRRAAGEWARVSPRGIAR